MLSAATRRQRFSRAGTRLPRVDHRSAAARRFRDVVNSLEAELGGGDLSPADRSLVKQAAALVLQAEHMQAAIAGGEQIDTDSFIRISSEARRALNELRARAVKNKPAGHDALTEHLRSKYGVGDADNGGLDEEAAVE